MAASVIVSSLFQIQTVPDFHGNLVLRRMHEKPRALKGLKCLAIVHFLSCIVNLPMGSYESVFPEFLLLPNKTLNVIVKYFSFSLVSYISNFRYYSTPVIKYYSLFFDNLDFNADELVNIHDRRRKAVALYSIG